jgi:hypothetical protein
MDCRSGQTGLASSSETVEGKAPWCSGWWRGSGARLCRWPRCSGKAGVAHSGCRSPCNSVDVVGLARLPELVKWLRDCELAAAVFVGR